MLKEVDIDEFYKEGFDLIIDARSPKEYKESHIPTSHNLYALSDKEHHEIGEMYVQKSKQDAKILGASHICHNVSNHLKWLNINVKVGSKIGIYCARGGLRSTSIATILSLADYRVYKIKRGYKEYRQYVLSYIENFEHKNFIVLGGNTGCGKSELIQKLSPSIDLERLANHFGSTFGLMNGNQPNQKAFQNNLMYELQNINPKYFLFIEAESKKIGSIIQPDLLYKRIQSGIRVEVTAPIQQRVERILKDYINIDDEYFYKSMNKITPYIQKSAKLDAIDHYKKGNLDIVAEILLVDYYDKVYRKPKKIDYIISNENENSALAELKSIAKKFNSIDVTYS